MSETTSQISEGKKKRTVSVALGWLFGVFFLMPGIGGILSGDYLPGFGCLIMAAVLLPPSSKFIEQKIKLRLTRVVKSAVLVVAFIIIVATIPKKEAINPTPPQPSPQVSEQKEVPKPPKQKKITYEIVERWSIPNGGEGKAIIISPDYLNETDMTALGKKLMNEAKNDRHAFVEVFNDKQAALWRDESASEKLNAEDQEFWFKHYVGQYNKNSVTGYHKFDIWFDGITGKNNKTISFEGGSILYKMFHGDAENPPQEENPNPTTSNEAHNRLIKMANGERNDMFTKLLESSGERCNAVTRNFHQGSADDGESFWNVVCKNKEAYVISIANDSEGSTKILDCAVLKSVGGGECFKKFDQSTQ